jgi:hypothetical protein
MCKFPTTLTTAPPARSSSEKLTQGGIAGVVIGSVAGLALVILGIVFLLRGRSRGSSHEPQEQNNGPASGNSKDHQYYGPEADIQTSRTTRERTIGFIKHSLGTNRDIQG